jgi:hypothetical protein
MLAILRAYIYFMHIQLQVAAAYLAQMYINTCVRAKICHRRNYYTIVRRKIKAGGYKRHVLLYTEG